MKIQGYISHSLDSLSSDLKNIQTNLEIKEKRIKQPQKIDEQVVKKLGEIREKSKALISIRIENLEKKHKIDMQFSVDKEEEENKREAVRTKRLQYRQNLEYGRMAVKTRNEEIARQVRLNSEKQKGRSDLIKEQRKSVILPNIRAQFLKEINRKDIFRRRRMQVSDSLSFASEVKFYTNALENKERKLVNRLKINERVKSYR